jgi:hypothetical protein
VLDEPGLQATFGHDRAVLTARDAELSAIEADLMDWVDRPVTFMGFTGVLPFEHSSGGTAHRGDITETGNEHLGTCASGKWACRRLAHADSISWDSCACHGGRRADTTRTRDASGHHRRREDPPRHADRGPD